jgi:hypothetical protein
MTGSGWMERSGTVYGAPARWRERAKPGHPGVVERVYISAPERDSEPLRDSCAIVGTAHAAAVRERSQAVIPETPPVYGDASGAALPGRGRSGKRCDDPPTFARHPGNAQTLATCRPVRPLHRERSPCSARVRAERRRRERRRPPWPARRSRLPTPSRDPTRPLPS